MSFTSPGTLLSTDLDGGTSEFASSTSTQGHLAGGPGPRCFGITCTIQSTFTSTIHTTITSILTDSRSKSTRSLVFPTDSVIIPLPRPPSTSIHPTSTRETTTISIPSSSNTRTASTTPTASITLKPPAVQQSIPTNSTLPSPLSRSTSTPLTLPQRPSASDGKIVGGVLGAVSLIMLAVFVALTIWLKRRRRRRAGFRGDEPPRYDTTVTPFSMHVNEGRCPIRKGVVSIIARLFNRLKRLEQTERLGGTDDGRTQSDIATLSDPPPYSERPGISEAAIGARTVSSIPNGQLGQGSPRRDRKNLGRNGH